MYYLCIIFSSSTVAETPIVGVLGCYDNVQACGYPLVFVLLPEPASNSLLTQQTPITALPARILCSSLTGLPWDVTVNKRTWTYTPDHQLGHSTMKPQFPWNLSPGTDYNGFKSQAKKKPMVTAQR